MARLELACPEGTVGFQPTGPPIAQHLRMEESGGIEPLRLITVPQVSGLVAGHSAAPSIELGGPPRSRTAHSRFAGDRLADWLATHGGEPENRTLPNTSFPLTSRFLRDDNSRIEAHTY